MSALEPSYENIIKQELQIADLKRAYHALMKRAVRFAEKLGKEIVTGGFSYIEYPEEVQDFLSSPDVLKWREQQEGL